MAKLAVIRKNINRNSNKKDHKTSGRSSGTFETNGQGGDKRKSFYNQDIPTITYNKTSENTNNFSPKKASIIKKSSSSSSSKATNNELSSSSSQRSSRLETQHQSYNKNNTNRPKKTDKNTTTACWPSPSVDDDNNDDGDVQLRRTNNKEGRHVRWNSLIESECGADVIFLVGSEPDIQRIAAHSWILASGSPVFKVMFRGPLSEFRRSGGGGGSDLTADESANSATTSLISSTAQAATVGSSAAAGAYSASSAFGGISNFEAVRRRTTVAVSDVDGRAFDILLRYLYNETVNLQSVMTALTTLYAAHKYMCPGLAKIVVAYLREQLSERNVLLILQHICLYCNNKSAGPQNQPKTGHAMAVGWPDEPTTESNSAKNLPITRDQLPIRAYRFEKEKNESGPRATSVVINSSGGARTNLLAPSAPPLEEEPLLLNEEEEFDYSDIFHQPSYTGLSDHREVARQSDRISSFRSKLDQNSAASKNNSSNQSGDRLSNCCSLLLKECLDLVDAEAARVLGSEDLEDVDVSVLKMVVCRETLNCANGEGDVYQALLRWSGRECKRQRLELTRANRRKVLEGAQFLVRYLTMSQEELLRNSGLLTEEETDCLLSLIEVTNSGNDDVSGVFMPDHLAQVWSIMRCKRKGNNAKSSNQSKKESTSSKRLKGFGKLKKSGKAKTSKKVKAAEIEAEGQIEEAASVQESTKMIQLHSQRNKEKEKFNLIEEFFICLACIFD